MKKLFLSAVAIVFLLSAQVLADCGTVTGTLDALEINIPCTDFMGSQYNIFLDLYHNPLDNKNLFFKLRDITVSSPGSSCAYVSDKENHWDINIYCAEYAGTNLGLNLEYIGFGDKGLYWKLISVTDAANGKNQKPFAESISLNVDSTLPYIMQQLAGNDPDNDVITYELVSNPAGTGYSSAYVNPGTGMLYLTNEPAGNDSFSISYRVTDGQLFSDQANVNVHVTYLSEEDKDTGRNDVTPEEYARFKLSTYNSDLLGTVGNAPAQPQAIDLSPNFPTPGDQGNESSCVGWATAYALKSYQEKVEIGWSLNTPNHLFSPAFLYNQINYGEDRGSYINEALDLVVNKGLATLAATPYSAGDYKTQPSAAALAEALQYKAAGWSRVNDTSQIKAALVNRKPVVAGIAVYQQLMDLKGENSVYNTDAGANQGGHAITIVGYDDNRYGGAFKVINSWGQNFGDNGYFWMPYDFAKKVMSESYVLEDAPNGTEPVPEDPTEPVPDPNDTTLPNLTVESWDAAYDPHPGGTGSLTYSVKNTGAATACAGADINFMLSADKNISGNDYYVIYEKIPFDLEPGVSAYRDTAGSIEFKFPDQLEAGTYYMALWVDDLDVIAESNENDNISLGEKNITVETSLPDLSVNSWYAEWDGYGNGSLTYEVANTGGSSTTTGNWDINLVLDPDQITGNGNEIYLFYEAAGYTLNPGQYIYRDKSFPAYFNLYHDYLGSNVPYGIYYMALWVDDLNTLNESNEQNNGSYSSGTVSIGYGAVSNSAAKKSGADYIVAENQSRLRGKAYNGKKLPPKNLVLKKIEITRTASGKRGIKVLNQEQSCVKRGELSVLPTKNISASSTLIFPSGKRITMPHGDKANGK